MSINIETYALLKNKLDQEVSGLNSSMIKTVNGKEPDENGNVVIEGASAVDDIVRNNLASFKEDVILIQDEQPESDDNRIWVDSDTESVIIPEMSDVIAKTEKHLLTYENNSIKENDVTLTYDEVHAMLMDSPDFVVLVYNDRAYHPNRITNEQIVFITSYASNGYTTLERISMSNEGLITLTSSNSEMTANKVSGIADSNKGDTLKYPAVKAVVDYVDEAESRISESKIDKPADAPAVGKVLKVKQVNADGTFVCEWADEGHYELIDTITLSDDTEDFRITDEPNGNPYNFKKIIVQMEVPAQPTAINGYAAVRVAVGGSSYFITIGIIQNYVATAKRYLACAAYIDCGMLFGNAMNTGATSDSNGQALSTTINGMGVQVDGNITRFNIKKGSTSLPSGTIIKIYAVRA